MSSGLPSASQLLPHQYAIYQQEGAHFALPKGPKGLYSPTLATFPPDEMGIEANDNEGKHAIGQLELAICQRAGALVSGSLLTHDTWHRYDLAYTSTLAVSTGQTPTYPDMNIRIEHHVSLDGRSEGFAPCITQDDIAPKGAQHNYTSLCVAIGRQVPAPDDKDHFGVHYVVTDGFLDSSRPGYTPPTTKEGKPYPISAFRVVRVLQLLDALQFAGQYATPLPPNMRNEWKLGEFGRSVPVPV